jgi:hypothetical protein
MVDFSGTVQSDFLKLVSVEEAKKDSLIDYTAADFASIKAALIDYIKAVYPLDYQNFIESDLGIMLLELVAYMGANNSLKADLIANESYLSTARSRNNINKLLQLIGVRMKGPISAAANAKLTLDETPAWTNSSDYIELLPADRVVQVASPEDGAPLTFTLYKLLANGKVDLINGDGSIRSVRNEADSVTVFSNLVMLEGALVRETGSFNSNEQVKNIELTQSPVVEGSVEVFVDGDPATSGIYTQVENIFFASGATAKVFQIVSDDNFRATIVFGDGTLGTSPSIGDAYTILYRIGGGSRGNIKKSFINSTISLNYNDGADPSSITATIENESQGTGGANAETVTHAKRYAPLTFRRQDRVVTLEDFKTFANTFISPYGSTGKATAVTRRAFSSANIIDLYVLEKASDTQLRKATPEFKVELLESINNKKMLTDEVIVVDGLIRTFDLVTTIRILRNLRGKAEEIKLRVRDIILNFFDVDNWDFGRSLNTQELNNKIFALDEVIFSTVDNMPIITRVGFNEILQLNNLTINVEFV